MDSHWKCFLLIIYTCLLTKAERDVLYQDDPYYPQGTGGGSWPMMGGRLHPPKCIDIPSNLTLCKGIGYTQMRLPNLLDHDSLREVTQQARSWVPLLGIQCHPDTKLFLCSLFSPVCLDRAIWPCRNLCEGVKAGCESRMLQYRFPWPEMLRCDKFPEENDLCIGLQTKNRPVETKCGPCAKPHTVAGIVDNYCTANFVMKIKIREHVIKNEDIKIITQGKKKVYKKGNLTKKNLRKPTFYIKSGLKCDCPSLEERKKTDYFLAMGSKEGDKLVLSFLHGFSRKDSVARAALRRLKKEANICKGGLPALKVNDVPMPRRSRKGVNDRKQEERKKKKNGKRKDENGEKKKSKRKGRKGSKRRNRKNKQANTTMVPSTN